MDILRTPITVISFQTWGKSSMQVSFPCIHESLFIVCNKHVNSKITFLKAKQHRVPMTWRCVSLSGQSMNISNIHVRSMLPENLSNFFRYEGSLTTPPCFESIIWTVFDTPITLSHNQVWWGTNTKVQDLTRRADIDFIILVAAPRSGNWRAR